MRKIIGLVVVCIVSCINLAYAASWDVEVVSDKDIYSFGEKAVFKVKVKKNNKWVMPKHMILEATFPDSNSPVTLEHITLGRYRFSTKLTSISEQQRFDVFVFQNNKPKRLLAQATKTITLITESNNSFRVKEGDFVNKNAITLLIDSNENYELMVSEDPLFTDCLWTRYAQEIPYILSNNDGKKTIYLKFRNRVSLREQLESKQITLDTIIPEVTILSPVEGNVVTGRIN